jgi:hypothetical protein
MVRRKFSLSPYRRPTLVAGAVLLTACVTAPGGVTTSFGRASAHKPVCPRTDRHLPTAKSQVKIEVLVSGGARAVLLCRYRGVNPDPTRTETLARSRVITSSAIVAKLAQRFDKLQPAAPGTYACPADDQSKIIAIFQFSHGPSGPVVTSLEGCRLVTNGRVSRTALYAPGAQLVSQLKALTH